MYLNIVQLAESFGVEEHVVEGWVRNEGLPSVPDRGRLLFDRGQVVEWAAEHGLASKAGFLASSRPSAGSTGKLETLLRTGGIWRDVAAVNVTEVLERVIAKLPGTTPAIRTLLAQRVRADDSVNWAPIGNGLALPHLRSPVALGHDAGIIALLMLRDVLPLTEPPPDNIAVTRLLFFIAPSPRVHLELLAQFSVALTRGGLSRVVLEAAPDERIFASLATAETTTPGQEAK